MGQRELVIEFGGAPEHVALGSGQYPAVVFPGTEQDAGRPVTDGHRPVLAAGEEVDQQRVIGGNGNRWGHLDRPIGEEVVIPQIAFVPVDVALPAADDDLVLDDVAS